LFLIHRFWIVHRLAVIKCSKETIRSISIKLSINYMQHKNLMWKYHIKLHILKDIYNHR